MKRIDLVVALVVVLAVAAFVWDQSRDPRKA